MIQFMNLREYLYVFAQRDYLIEELCSTRRFTYRNVYIPQILGFSTFTTGGKMSVAKKIEKGSIQELESLMDSVSEKSKDMHEQFKKSYVVGYKRTHKIFKGIMNDNKQIIDLRAQRQGYGQGMTAEYFISIYTGKRKISYDTTYLLESLQDRIGTQISNMIVVSKWLHSIESGLISEQDNPPSNVAHFRKIGELFGYYFKVTESVVDLLSWLQVAKKEATNEIEHSKQLDKVISTMNDHITQVLVRYRICSTVVAEFLNKSKLLGGPTALHKHKKKFISKFLNKVVKKGEWTLTQKNNLHLIVEMFQ